jgi:hypothetical protein
VAEKPVYYVLSSVDTSSRGILQSHEYAQPGDPFTGYELFTIDVNGKKDEGVSKVRGAFFLFYGDV